MHLQLLIGKICDCISHILYGPVWMHKHLEHGLFFTSSAFKKTNIFMMAMKSRHIHPLFSRRILPFFESQPHLVARTVTGSNKHSEFNAGRPTKPCVNTPRPTFFFLSIICSREFKVSSSESSKIKAWARRLVSSHPGCCSGPPGGLM